MAKQIEIAAHDSNTSGKKTKHKTSLSLPLTKVAFGKQQQAFACLFPSGQGRQL